MTEGRRKGYMLIEVLLALSLFAYAAVVVVNGISPLLQAVHRMKVLDDRELEQHLLWARNLILEKSANYEDFEKADEIESLMIGDIEYTAEARSSEYPDLFYVTLELSWDGNDEIGVDSGERSFDFLLFRPTWSSHRDFPTEQSRAREEERERIQLWQEEDQKNQW